MFSAKGRKLVYVGENTTMVTLTSYFIQPWPCQFLLIVNGNRTKYNKKYLRSLTDAVIIWIIPQNFSNSVRAWSITLCVHDVPYGQSPLVGLFAHANFSNMKDSNDSAHKILKVTMMLERNLFSKGIHDDDGHKNARKQCWFKEQNYSTASE